MGKKGKKAQAGKPKKLTPKDIGKRLNVLVRKLEVELKKGADLFAPLPPTEDCAICLVPLPHAPPQICFQPCCGKDICKACYKENKASINKQNEETGKKIVFSCPFCREPDPTSVDEELAQLQGRCLHNDHNAFTQMGEVYRRGKYGLAKDDLKGLHCWIRAVELGSPGACTSIGHCYREGCGVAVNKERSALFERVGALRGDMVARYNIGYSEYDLGNHEIAIRHWKIAAEAGYQKSLDALRDIYNKKLSGNEFISKEYLDSIYRACHEAQMEVATEEREKHRLKE